MDKGEKNNASEEKAHIPMENGRSSTEKYLPEQKKNEKVLYANYALSLLLQTLPVEVFFTLESSRLIHRPGQCRFREKWLKDIIENKIILVERLTSQ
ncbi:Akap14 [Columba guinea]|nr:Akap14 [Columba guinea]